MYSIYLLRLGLTPDNYVQLYVHYITRYLHTYMQLYTHCIPYTSSILPPLFRASALAFPAGASTAPPSCVASATPPGYAVATAQNRNRGGG